MNIRVKVNASFRILLVFNLFLRFLWQNNRKKIIDWIIKLLALKFELCYCLMHE